MKIRVDFEGWPVAPFAAKIEAEAASAEALEDLRAEAERERHWPSVLLARMSLAQLHYENERGQLAHRNAMAALLIAQEIGDLLAEAQIRRLLALLAWDEGRSKDGHDHILEAVAAYEQVGESKEIPVLMRWYGEHLGVLGAYPEADQALADAEKRFRDAGDESGAQACAADRLAVKARVAKH